jgi:hypothetical protein
MFSSHIKPTKVRGKHYNPILFNGIDSIAALLIASFIEDGHDHYGQESGRAGLCELHQAPSSME